ncbi:MAG: hypothetical protein LW865_01825 [Betaproteobacteria bacterium]|jgi:hypothetical protein|nr:hypothetical protein [Rhodocyclaceae bacterium]MCE2722013.1 hypothetical protein [Betaproteobacteria bacterium]
MSSLTKAQQRANLLAVIAALSAANIARVDLEYEGCGDSGQIESVYAFDGKGSEVTLPDVKVRITTARYEHPAGYVSAPEDADLEDAMKQIAYEKLEYHYGGWEINEGSKGSVVFNMESRELEVRNMPYAEELCETISFDENEESSEPA